MGAMRFWLAGLVAMACAFAGATAGDDDDARAQAPAADPLRVYVLVLDGLRPAEVTPELMPNLSALRAEGTWYEQARSVFVAETLPNHAAMMTGVTPGRGGIVSNDYWRPNDQGAQRFRMDDPALLTSDTLNTRIETACSEIATANVLSKEYLWKLFRPETPTAGDPNPQRSADYHWDPQSSPLFIGAPDDHTPDAPTWNEGFLPWFRATENDRQFAFLNLGDIDRAGHIDQSGGTTSGGMTAARIAALKDSDTLLGQVVDEMKASGAWDESVLLIASDHGMDWGLQNNWLSPAQVLNTAGYSSDGSGEPGTKAGSEGDYMTADGGSTSIVYAEDDEDVKGMAEALAAASGVQVVTTREPVPGLNNPTHAEYGLDDAGGRAGDIVVFAKPGWFVYGQLPGNHGHPVTQQSTLLVSGGHAVLDDELESVAGTTVFDAQLKPNGSPPTGGPGNLSIAPTVAALFGLGQPEGGYDRPPLTEAFEDYALEPHAPCQAADPAGTIPSLSVADVQLTEGDAGSQEATFSVGLSTPYSETITVDYATADGTATAADGDYDPRAGTLTFTPGQTTASVTVPVRGDTRDEPDEAFALSLSRPTGGAVLADAAAEGRIADDDEPGEDPGPGEEPDGDDEKPGGEEQVKETPREERTAPPIAGPAPEPVPPLAIAVPDAPCTRAATLIGATARPRGRRVALSFARVADRPVDVDVFQTSVGRRLVGERLVARFAGVRRPFSWNGRANRAGRRVSDGWFVVRFALTDAAGRREVRRVALRRAGGRWSRGPVFDDPRTCALIATLKLERPVFGGRANGDLGISYTLELPARATVEVLHDGRVVERFGPADRQAGQPYRARFDAEGRPRGLYEVRVTAERANVVVTRTVFARRI